MASETPAPQPSFLPGPAVAPRSFSALLGLSMRRPGGRRSLTGLISVLVLAAVSLFGYPAYTDLLQRHNQVKVEANFNKPGVKTVYLNHHVKIGAGLTKLLINNPRVKVNVVVVEGTTVAALMAGAGHYVNTPYPCGPTGNVGIAGHRTTYGRPFNRINYMHPGDTVKLITPVSSCVYRVVAPSTITSPAVETSNPFVVLPNDQAVVSQDAALPIGPQMLTLTSCNPPGSASQRIVLRLQMISCHGSTCHQQKGTT
jgi:sortase A